MWKLGIDADRTKLPYWKILAIYFNMKYNYGEVEIYRTENGYHFIAKNVETSLEARWGLGDDEKRVWLSELRSYVSGYVDDVLYEVKWDGKRWRKRERIDEWHLLADPFWHFPVRKPKNRSRRWC